MRSLLFLLLLSACGGAVADEPTADAPARGPATPTFVVDASTCSTGVTPSAEAAVARADGDELAVVEIHFVEECTGLGGTWVLGREVDSHRRFFLGAHGCRLWKSTPSGAYGVVRHRQTAALLRTPDGACVGLPGERRVESDQSTYGFVVFATRAEAEAFAAARGWKRR